MALSCGSMHVLEQHDSGGAEGIAGQTNLEVDMQEQCKLDVGPAAKKKIGKEGGEEGREGVHLPTAGMWHAFTAYTSIMLIVDY